MPRTRRAVAPQRAFRMAATPQNELQLSDLVLVAAAFCVCPFISAFGFGAGWVNGLVAAVAVLGVVLQSKLIVVACGDLPRAPREQAHAPSPLLLRARDLPPPTCSRLLPPTFLFVKDSPLRRAACCYNEVAATAA